MKPFLSMIFATLLLNGEISVDGEFIVVTAPTFSITIEEESSSTLFRTMSFDFTGNTSESAVEMGIYNVQVLDTTTQTSGDSNIVYAYGHLLSGSTIQIRRQNQARDITTDEDRINLDVLDSLNSDGTAAGGGGRAITSGSIIRQRDHPEAVISPAETHKITVRSAAGSHNGKTAGNYVGTMYFALISTP